jgi:hypothetical protein
VRLKKESRIMHMPPPSAQETAQAIELGHEPSTVSVRGIAWFLVIFSAFVAVVLVLVLLLYRGLEKYEQSQNVERSAVARAVEVHPPEPRLQPTMHWHETTEPEDLALMRGRENLEFVQRGWINKETGEFRVPDDVINAVAASNGSPIDASPTTNPASGGTGGGMPK